MVEIKLLCFTWLSLFFKWVHKGVPGFAKVQAIFTVNAVLVLFHLSSFHDESVHVSGFTRTDGTSA